MKDRFRPSSIDDFRHAAGQDMVQIPVLFNRPRTRTEIGTEALADISEWRRNMTGMAQSRPKVFVMEDEKPETMRQTFLECKATCEAMAEHGLLKLPYPLVWVEQANLYDDETRRDARFAVLATGYDKEQIKTHERYGLPHGDYAVVYRSLSFLFDNRTWYDTIYTGCILVANGKMETLTACDYPNMEKCLDRLAKESKVETDPESSFLNDLCMSAVESGKRLVMNLLAALATSWVDKAETEPKGPVTVSRFFKVKGKAKPKRKVMRVSNSTGYTYVSSFHESAMRRIETAGRKEILPHLRRGHIHRFWTGPRNDPDRRKLVAKFVEPTWVNAEKNLGMDDVDKRYKVESTA